MIELTFEKDTHTYWLDGRQIPSCSSILAKLKAPFDKKKWSAHCARKRGVPITQILKEWEEKRDNACDTGHVCHEHISHVLDKGFFEGDFPFPEKSIGALKLEAFEKFWLQAQKNLQRVATEKMMVNEELHVAGTCDAVFYSSKTMRHHIFDWKQNAVFKTENQWQKLLPPFDDLDDCHLENYSLQLSLYRLLVGHDTGHSYIVHLGMDGEFKTYRAHDYRSRLEEWLLTERLRSETPE